MSKPTGLYIHIPYCRRKCSYCDFYSFAPGSNETDAYIRSLANIFSGLKQYYKERTFSSVYIGGGTPSLLGTSILPLMEAVQKNFNISPAAEITAEVNPESAAAFLPHARAAGVNRVSIGFQSGNDKMLGLLGRLHNSAEARAAVDTALRLGFKNISGDLMIALPFSTLDSLNSDIDFLLNMPLTHISAYILKAEKGTPLYSSKITLPGDDEAAEQYLFTCERLQNAGFIHYEISNFAKPGFEGRHNLNYWQCGEYLGIGPGAHSFIDGRRFYYPRDIKAFLCGSEPVFEGEGGGEEERFMLALRLAYGVKLADYPFLNNAAAKQKINRLEAAGYLTFNGETIALTDKGFLVSNNIITELYNENL